MGLSNLVGGELRAGKCVSWCVPHSATARSKLAHVLQLADCETNLDQAATLEYFLAGFTYPCQHLHACL
jgi:hypothetical protein